MATRLERRCGPATAALERVHDVAADRGEEWTERRVGQLRQAPAVVRCDHEPAPRAEYAAKLVEYRPRVDQPRDEADGDDQVDTRVVARKTRCIGLGEV